MSRPHKVSTHSSHSPLRTKASSSKLQHTSSTTSSSSPTVPSPPPPPQDLEPRSPSSGGFSSPTSSSSTGSLRRYNPLEAQTPKGKAAQEQNRGAKENRVQVAVRIRPHTKADGNVSDKVLSLDGQYGIKINKAGDQEKKFYYDYVFTEGQEEVYDCIGRAMMSDALEGYNVTLFAYGQTGSGKTYSIQGVPHDPNMAGVVPRFCHDLLTVAQYQMEEDATLSVKIAMSMIEIYNEKVRDLLEKKNHGQAQLTELEIHESKDKKIYVEGLSLHTVTSHERFWSLIQQGLANRQVHETNMNEHSSRSHSIMQFIISQTHDPPRPGVKDVESLINIVDLAGSERQGKTGATGDRFEESKKINHSLLMLGRALNTFSDGKAEYVPLRESKLTRLLSESFGGNARTWMLACVSPSVFNYTETMSTLQYAQNAKAIVNKAKVNALQEKLEFKQLQMKYSQLEKMYDDEREKSKQLQLELQRRAELIQALQKELQDSRSTGSLMIPQSPSSSSFKGMFVGRAHLSLKNVLQLSSNYVTLPLITDQLDCDGALLMVSTYPVRKNKDQTVENAELKDLLGKRLDLIVHVISAKNIPEQYSGTVYCKYVFKHAEKDVYQSYEVSGCNPEFDYKKRFAFGSLTQQLADYLGSANVLTFEVIGRPEKGESLPFTRIESEADPNNE